MSSLLEGKNEKQGVNKIFLVGAVLAVLVVVGIVVGVIIMPTPEEEKQAVLADSFKEGSPEFDEYTKQIIVSTDPERLIESSTGLGDIIMQIGGSVYNRGDKTVTGLEMSVGMIDSKGELIKDKKVLVIPKEYPELKPKETIDVSVNVPGFEPDDDRANARWKVTAIKLK